MKGLNRMVIPSFFFLLMLTFIVYPSIEWPYGSSNGDIGETNWDSIRNNEAYREISNPYTMQGFLSNPVYGDIDNDGYIEFAVIDGSAYNSMQIEIYNITDGEIMVETAKALATGTSEAILKYSDLALVDGDDDGYLEVMVASTGYSGRIYWQSFEWNGTGIGAIEPTNAYYGATFSNYAGFNVHMTCDVNDDDVCLIWRMGADGYMMWEIVPQDGGAVIQNKQRVIIPGDTPCGITSVWENGRALDIDGIGRNEVIEVGIAIPADGDDARIIYTTIRVNASGSTSSVETYNASYNIGQIDPTGCTTAEGKMAGFNITNPVTYNWDSGQDGTNMETIVAYMDKGDVCISYFSYNGLHLENECGGGFLTNDDMLRGGGYLSNAVRAKITEDSGNHGFCFIHYAFDADNDDEYNDNALICWNPVNGEYYIWADEDKMFDTTAISPMYRDWGSGKGQPKNLAIWVTESIPNTLARGAEYDEFITPFGVLVLNQEGLVVSLSAVDHYDGTIVFENPYSVNGLLTGIMPLEYDSEEEVDILLVSNTSIWFIDDIVYNEEPVIQNYSFNPGMDQGPIKVNETGYLKFRFEDEEHDSVNYSVCIYCGTSNEQKKNATGVVDMTWVTFITQYNLTITDAIMEINWTDSEEPFTLSTLQQEFSVASVGWEYNDYTQSGNTIPDEEIDTDGDGIPDVDDPDADGNGILDVNETDAVTNLLEEIDEGFGLNLGTSVLWMAIIVIVAGYVWIKGSDANPMATLGVIAFIVMFLVVIGVTLGFIDAWLLVLIIVLAIAVISFSFIGWWRGG